VVTSVGVGLDGDCEAVRVVANADDGARQHGVGRVEDPPLQQRRGLCAARNGGAAHHDASQRKSRQGRHHDPAGGVWVHADEQINPKLYAFALDFHTVIDAVHPPPVAGGASVSFMHPLSVDAASSGITAIAHGQPAQLA
ncbi:MAG TPA: hypothetical protein VEP46_15060, partial [Vicinamibacterales bacterium]|nr:hypothetical protein [Vicinamibacterales bacterium]